MKSEVASVNGSFVRTADACRKARWVNFGRRLGWKCLTVLSNTAPGSQKSMTSGAMGISSVALLCHGLSLGQLRQAYLGDAMGRMQCQDLLVV